MLLVYFRTQPVQKCNHFFVPGDLKAILWDCGTLMSGVGTTYVFLLLSCDAAGLLFESLQVFTNLSEAGWKSLK